MDGRGLRLHAHVLFSYQTRYIGCLIRRTRFGFVRVHSRVFDARRTFAHYTVRLPARV